MQKEPSSPGTVNQQVLGPIAAHLAEWETAHVELAIYGTSDPGRVASSIDAFCRQVLECAPEQTLFYQSSISAVAGLRLRDGRLIVLKAQQPDWTHARLQQVARVQSQVASRLGLAPRVLAGPIPLGKGLAMVEEYLDRGLIRDGHEAPVRRALAHSLHGLIEFLSRMTLESELPPSISTAAPAGALWPQPHSRLFDFEATSPGAEYIDTVAAAARERMRRVGRRIIGHSDWRAEHVRFEGERPVVAYDWGSLCQEQEAALVGATAHMFCANWSRDDIAQAPTLEEARMFVSDYEDAAGRKFSREERKLCGAAFAYAVAYTARCGHACEVVARDVPGSFQHLIATSGRRLLEL